MDTKIRNLAYKLEGYHSIFYKICEIGRIEWTDKIPTAAVSFDRKGNCILFQFNETWYDELSDAERCFIIAHECLHILFNHGTRSQGLIHEYANIAEDLVINEMLFNGFGFSRNLGIFKDSVDEQGNKKNGGVTHKGLEEYLKVSLERNREFEYYYDQMLTEKPPIFLSFDIHSGLPIDSLGDIERLVSQMSNKDKESLKKKLGKQDLGEDSKDDSKESEEKNEVDKARGAGKGSSFNWEYADFKEKPLVRWTKFLTSACKRTKRQKLESQWKRVNRRFVTLNTSLLLPSDGNEEALEELIDAVIFVDVSGSCHGYVKKFAAEARKIPRREYMLESYAFDDNIIPFDLKQDKVPYGGGTSFHQLEEHLLKRKKYPDIVFVMTDGYGTEVRPKIPDRWHIFLTVDFKQCFPTVKNFHMLDITL